MFFFFFSSRRRHTRFSRDWSSDVCSSDLARQQSDPERPIGLLSGGNQQKALLARWLATKPRLLILDEPTRGIDVGAHAEIIRLIRQLCADGLALLVISSEIEEVVIYADKVVVLRDRAHIVTLSGDNITVPAVLSTIAAETRHVA